MLNLQKQGTDIMGTREMQEYCVQKECDRNINAVIAANRGHEAEEYGSTAHQRCWFYLLSAG